MAHLPQAATDPRFVLEAIKIEPKNACDESNSDPSRLSLCDVLGHFSLVVAKIGGAIK